MGPDEGGAQRVSQLTCSCLRSRVLGNGAELQLQFLGRRDSSWRARAEVSPQLEDWRLTFRGWRMAGDRSRGLTAQRKVEASPVQKNKSDHSSKSRW